MFEIHMDSTADAAMNPSTRRDGLAPPKSRTIISARRRWEPLLSMAAERTKPPRKRQPHPRRKVKRGFPAGSQLPRTLT